MRLRAMLATAVLAFPAMAADWVRVSTPLTATGQIEILTDAGERTGRQVLARFDDVRRIFRQANSPDSSLALRVFVFASEKEFRNYRDGTATDGFYQSAPERDYIALHAGSDVGRAVVHEYVHVLLNHSTAPLPTWFEEGTAEFYSTLALDRDRLWVGQPIDSHLRVLAEEHWLSADQLLAVSHGSPYYNERSLAGIFYAESWALMHMLNLAPSYREGMPRFVLALADKQNAEAAFKDAFGVTMEKAVADLPGYLRNLRAGTVHAPPEEAPERPRVERLSTLEATLNRADLALHVSHFELARTLFEGAAHSNPQSPEAAASLGALAVAEDRKDEARQSLERAINLGNRDAGTYFELEMLERDSRGEPARINLLLEKAIAANPNFAEAHFLLGSRAADDGDYAVAIEHLSEAVRILPRQSYFWHALGYAQAKTGRTQDAAESAQRAIVTAVTDEQEQMARALVEDLRSRDARGRSAQGPGEGRLTKLQVGTVTPATWQNSRGDARIEGTLTRVDCLSASAQLHMEVPSGRTVVVAVHDPNKVELVNAPAISYQFSCGPQALHIAVEYQSGALEATRIEFLP